MPVIKLAKEAHIYERITPDHRLTGYQVKIRRVGYPPYTKTFDDLKEARIAVTRVLADQSRGLRINPLLAERSTLADVIKSAIKELENGTRVVKGKTAELCRLRGFLKREQALCAHTMSLLTDTMMEDWRDQRLEEVKPGTVLRELRLLRPILATATRRLQLPVSPLHYVKNPTVRDERVARLAPGEETRLFDALAKRENRWVLPAAEFSLETACRRSELLRLDWKDFNHRQGTVYLHDAKNGRGRHILLTRQAQAILEALPDREASGPIFKISAEALKQAYERARTAAKMPHWRWHDLRHEAISRAFDAGLTAEQVMDFSGHVDMKSLLRYRHPDIARSVAVIRLMEANRTTRLRVIA